MSATEAYVFEKVRGAVLFAVEMPPEEITYDTTLEDIKRAGADSLDIAEIFIEAEELLELPGELPNESDVETVGEIVYNAMMMKGMAEA